MEPRKQGLVFLASGALLLVVSTVLFVEAGDGVDRNCFAYIFCDTYEGVEGGAAHAFGLIGIAVGLIAVVWGALVWFLVPIILREEPPGPNRPPGP